MKNSTVIKHARTLLAYDPSDCTVPNVREEFSCCAVGRAAFELTCLDNYNDAYVHRRAYAELLDGRHIIIADREIECMNMTQLQEFRFLLMCMAEQYFLSIGE